MTDPRDVHQQDQIAAGMRDATLPTAEAYHSFKRQQLPEALCQKLTTIYFTKVLDNVFGLWSLPPDLGEDE